MWAFQFTSNHVDNLLLEIATLLEINIVYAYLESECHEGIHTEKDSRRKTLRIYAKWNPWDEYADICGQIHLKCINFLADIDLMFQMDYG